MTLALCACGVADRLLSVEPQDRVPAAPIEDSPANALLLANGAVADFDCAFGAYVVIGGLIGEELDETRSIVDRKPYDQRVHTSKDRVYAVNRCESMGVYTPLQTARVSAERVLRLLDAWSDAEVPQRATLIARLHAYAGYSTLLLGEGFCTTVISSLDATREVVYGGEISRDSAIRVAEARLSAGIIAAQAAGASNEVNFALVGRARARLDLRDFAGARSDAMRVPPAFTYEMTASASSLRRNNRVWAQERTSGLTSVGVPYRSLGDPRVPVIDMRQRSPRGDSTFFNQNKYPSASSPIRIASGAEAQLIIAESDIAAGTASSLQNAAAIVNTFRARGNQPPLSTADQTTLRAALIDQRRRELYLEGQHLGDIIRFDVTLTPAAGTRFPGGGVYGSQKCLALPDVERLNNPALSRWF
jgi:starch-binding outer membrane protein, SusD/RagB family